MTDRTANLPAFGRVLEQLDGRLPPAMGPSLYDIVANAAWGLKPSEWRPKDQGYSSAEFKGEWPEENLCKMIFRTQWYNQSSVPQSQAIRLTIEDSLFPGKATEHRFSMENDLWVYARGGLHSKPWFIPFYGHPHAYQFPDAQKHGVNWTYRRIKEEGPHSLLAEGPHQIWCALWLLTASIDRNTGSLNLLPTREEASRKVAKMIQATSYGD